MELESQNSPLPLFYCSEPAQPAVRLGGRETRPLVAASDRFQSPTMLCPSQITIHFWLLCFSSVWIQKAVWGSLTNAMFLCSDPTFFYSTFNWKAKSGELTHLYSYRLFESAKRIRMSGKLSSFPVYFSFLGFFFVHLSQSLSNNRKYSFLKMTLCG